MDSFTIKELETLSGIKAHTIRIWEQRFSFITPCRTSTNIRYYSCEELKKILNIALLNKYGFKISHIKRMGEAEVKKKILLLSDEKAVQDRVINNMVQQMVDLNIESFEQIINNEISEKGIEKTVLQIIFPFLERTGILWHTGYLNPAQEQLVTAFIRQKLVVAVESAASPVTLKKSFILFLPEGERHELVLLFMYYLLRSRGTPVIYLGANVPLKDVAYLVKLKKPDIVFTHLTCNTSKFDFQKFLTEIKKNLPDVMTFISGRIEQHFIKKPPTGIHFKKSFSEVMQNLSLL